MIFDILKRFRQYLQALSRRLRPYPPLPKVSLPYNAQLKRQQERWLITFVLLIALTLYYVYVYLNQQYELKQPVTVLTWSEDLTRPTMVTAQHLVPQTFPLEQLPAGYFEPTQKDDLVGQTLVRDVVHKELALPHQLQAKLNPDSVSAKFEEAFAFTMDENWFQAKLPNLKAGDVIDVIVSNPEADLEATVTVAQNLEVVTVQRLNQKKTLIVNLTDEQAKQILFARGLRLPMQVLLHSALGTPSSILNP